MAFRRVEGNLDSEVGESLPVESEIREILLLETGILGFGIRIIA